jgi:leader peptidase (prepilin peptidase)/N-methyltransferase
MIRILGTVFAALAGLAFGSFLNVCVSRWPEGESIVHPRSHCRGCGRTLAWWENVPLLSWMALGGRCRRCRAWIGWRYPLVELAVGALWAISVWQFFSAVPGLGFTAISYPVSIHLVNCAARLIFLWLLVALAVLDAENLWLPDWLTWPGIGLGLVLGLTRATLDTFTHLGGGFAVWKHMAVAAAVFWFLGAVPAAALVLVIRWVYFLIRRQEGVGLGDAKLMAMIGGWLGLKGALLAFGLGVGTGAVAALLWLAGPSGRAKSGEWGQMKLPFGTFLCLGGIVSGLWGESILAAYLRWAGF